MAQPTLAKDSSDVPAKLILDFCEILVLHELLTSQALWKSSATSLQ
jgi:hypothetical protein